MSSPRIRHESLDTIKLGLFFFTVKASNFEPHGNFGAFLARPVASLGTLCTKNEQSRLCKSEVFYNFHFLHILVGRFLMMASPTEKSLKFT